MILRHNAFLSSVSCVLYDIRSTSVFQCVPEVRVLSQWDPRTLYQWQQPSQRPSAPTLKEQIPLSRPQSTFWSHLLNSVHIWLNWMKLYLIVSHVLLCVVGVWWRSLVRWCCLSQQGSPDTSPLIPVHQCWPSPSASTVGWSRSFPTHSFCAGNT